MATKKKTNLYEQGTKTLEAPMMPASALVNTEAQKAGLAANTPLTNGVLNVQNITPNQPEAAQAAPVDTIYKGVDISKSFKASDFANPADYEQAKRRVESMNQGGAYGKQIEEQQAQQEIARKQAVLSELGAVGNISQQDLNQLIDQYGLSGFQQFKEGAAGALREAAPSALQTGLYTGLTAAGIGALGSAVGGGAAAGAVTGAIGGPAGIAIGAGAGIIFGLWKGLASAKKAEAKEDVSNAMSEFTQLKTGMTQVATLASAGYINEVEAVELYNAQLTRMLQIEAEIKYLQDTNLKDYLSGGSDSLAEVQSYLNNVAPVYAMRIRTSLINPTTKVPYSDIVMQDMENQNA